jgi:branched-subunit amino acid transport protein AzlD
MRADLVIVALVVGIGTWLFRFLPTRLRGLADLQNPRLTRAMESVGPAAIATLFIASVLPAVSTAGERPLVLIGCAATVLAFSIRRNVVLATLIGTLAYGVAFALLGAGG